MGLVRGFYCGAALFMALLGLVFVSVGIATRGWAVLENIIHVGLWKTDYNGQSFDTVDFFFAIHWSVDSLRAIRGLMCTTVASSAVAFINLVVLQKRFDSQAVLVILALLFSAFASLSGLLCIIATAIFNSQDISTLYTLGYSFYLSLTGAILMWTSFSILAKAMKDGELNSNQDQYVQFENQSPQKI
ncbi:uncharacterized protein LOC101846030 [Aplysia californica]|uniref:Uncharacterized protein LOC101846030 n=1 Tax=Aplysia californica TaxID=6500 RepID=A0ABM0K3T6_APLCA|nr:uncharacterized protein LOC101846030 [Aplysia californica]